MKRVYGKRKLLAALIMGLILAFSAGCAGISVEDKDYDVSSDKEPRSDDQSGTKENKLTPKPTATPKPTEPAKTGTGEGSGEGTGTVEGSGTVEGTGTVETGSVTEGETAGEAGGPTVTDAPEPAEDDDRIKVNADGSWEAYYENPLNLLLVGDDPGETAESMRAFAERVRREIASEERIPYGEGLFAKHTPNGDFVDNGINSYAGGENGGKLDGSEQFIFLNYNVENGKLLGTNTWYIYITEDKNFLFMSDEPVTSDEEAWNLMVLPYIRP